MFEQGYHSWDGDRTRVCQCDFNYFGADCGQRRCPTGDDPNTHAYTFGHTTGKVGMTQKVTYQIYYPIAGPYYSSTAASAVPPYVPDGTSNNDMPALASQVHKLFEEHSTTVTDNSGVLSDTQADEHILLKFVDDYGAEYTAAAIGQVFSNSASNATPLQDAVEKALEGLPNQKVKDVTTAVITPFHRTWAATCPQLGPCDVPKVEFTVRFNPDIQTGNLVGKQNLLLCPPLASCNKPGCQPRIAAPYAIRYVGLQMDAGAVITTAGGEDMKFSNYNANLYNAFSAGFSMKLHPDSDPQLPAGGEPNNLGVPLATPVYRFDGRLEVVLVDHPDQAADDTALVYYKVGKMQSGLDTADGTFSGSDYINDDVRFKPSDLMHFKQSPGYSNGTLPGYELLGRLPVSGFDKVSIPGAPGVWVSFESANPIATAAVQLGGSASDADGRMMVYEMVWKLPSCDVAEYAGASDWQAVSKYVENIECSGRGQCDYAAGECECYAGYTGQSCSVRTTLA